MTRSTRPCLIRHNDVSIGLYRAALSYLPNIIDPCPTKSPPVLTVLSIDTSSVFLLCLISPQVIIPVQRIQSRLTALSIDTSSVFLLCLISPQVISHVQRIQSRLTALSIDTSSIFLLCESSYLTTTHRSCPTNSVSLDSLVVSFLTILVK